MGFTRVCAAVAALAMGQYGTVQNVGKATNVALHSGVAREERWQSNGHKGATLWMTGLSGSGKSTIAVALENNLVNEQNKPYFTYRLDGDNLRFGLNSDLGFSPEDRKENVRRVAEVAKLFADAGAIVLVGLIAPYKADREFARQIHQNSSIPFMEIYVDAPLAVAEARDPKGLYKKAREGKIKGFTGIDAPYEAPDTPELHLRTDLHSVPACVNQILDSLSKAGVHIPASFRHATEEERCQRPLEWEGEEGKQEKKELWGWWWCGERVCCQHRGGTGRSVRPFVTRVGGPGTAPVPRGVCPDPPRGSLPRSGRPGGGGVARSFFGGGEQGRQPRQAQALSAGGWLPPVAWAEDAQK
eukprot:CAMPEP_0204252334 /NCGR_PEP_ID=MMETSP0468-20130131/1117_1 /ASSEMBLY_ACC=CAM_ASM_000383 /TAXON_ID=2969 /ORGANISM="Oxyrrhis marina" /LENGTH=356 /DNA_ID=CAMNT_0051225755 /DNA_START=52 /DNA_END=1123 /DNA_ORIENTATION=+